MTKIYSLIVSTLARWIPLLVFIPILSWMVMMVTVLIVKHYIEDLPYSNGFSMWLCSLITAYVFCLYNFMRSKRVSINNESS
jgi:hypothetical protein